MRENSRPSLRAIALGVLLALVGSCSNGDGDDGGTPAAVNQAPVISSLTANPVSVLPSQSSALTVAATDPDGDPLTYTWSATGGTLAGSGAQVTWTAPATTGAFTINVTASDGQLSDQEGVPLAVMTPDGWLTGSYSFAGFEHDFSSSHHSAVTGTLTFDGAGAYTSSMTVNSDGQIGSQSPASTYSVNGAGDLSVDDGSGGVLSGGLDAAHEVAVVARVTATMNPLIVIAVKRSGTYMQSALSGDYHVAAFHWDPGGVTPAYSALAGVGTFDPDAGVFSFTATNNRGGTVYEVSASFNYAVASDGLLTITDTSNPANQFTGGVMTGGDLLVGATTGSGNKPMMLVAVRKSGSFGANTMAGSHRTVALDPSGAGASAWTGGHAFDGVDAWTAAGTLNDNGAVSSPSASGAYSITAAGHLTLNASPRVFSLGVREAGKAAAGAAVTAGEAPGFLFSVRR